MHKTIKELYHFQKTYLKQIVQNIPENHLYDQQIEGFNSAGWILGHLIVESEDVFNYLKIETVKIPSQWRKYFKRNSKSNLYELENLPVKAELVKLFELRYDQLLDVYLDLTNEERNAMHPSEMLSSFYSNVDAWFVHHLINHVAIHCGNITTWKRMIGLETNGF